MLFFSCMYQLNPVEVTLLSCVNAGETIDYLLRPHRQTEVCHCINTLFPNSLEKWSKHWNPPSTHQALLTSSHIGYIHLLRIKLGLSGLNSQRKKYYFIITTWPWPPGGDIGISLVRLSVRPNLFFRTVSYLRNRLVNIRLEEGIGCGISAHLFKI